MDAGTGSLLVPEAWFLRQGGVVVLVALKVGLGVLLCRLSRAYNLM